MKVSLRILYLMILAWALPIESVDSSQATSFFNQAVGVLGTIAQTSNATNTTLNAAQNVLQTTTNKPLSTNTTVQKVGGSGFVGALASGAASIATGLAQNSGSPALANVAGTLSSSAVSLIGNNSSFASVAQALLQKKQVATAIATFLINLPTALLNVIQNFNYNDQVLQVLSPSPTEAGQYFGFQIDFGFKGSGDISQPLGFILSNGKFFYKPIKASFVPDQFLVKDSSGALVPTEKFDIFQDPYKSLILSILKLTPQDIGMTAWSYFTRIFNPMASDIYFLKTLLLVCTAAKNEASNNGQYPSLTSLPMEFATLAQRLAKTPDLLPSMAMFPGVKDTSLWDPLKIVYIKTDIKNTLNTIPSFIKSKIDQITLPISADSMQEMADLDGKDLLQGFYLYGQLRSQDDYDKRSSFIKGTIFDFLTKSGASATATEMEKLSIGILSHMLERLRWIEIFLFTQFLDLTNINNIQSDGKIDIADLNLELVCAKLSALDYMVLKQKIELYFANLGQAISTILPILGTCKVRREILDAIAQQNQLLDSHKNEVISLILDTIKKAILVSSDANTMADFKTSYTQLKNHFDDFNAKRTDLIENTVSRPMVNVPFTQWAQYWFFKLDRLNFAKFSGDRGYYKDDTEISFSETVNSFMAIATRGIQDINKVTAAFKVDTSTLFDFTNNGVTKKTSCKDIYTETVEKPLALVSTRQEEYNKLLTQSTSATPLLAANSTKLQTAKDNLASALEIQTVSKLTFLSYLRQYLFDRRDSSGSYHGAIFDPASIAQIESQRADSLAASVNNNVRSLISKYNLNGPNAKARISALEDIAKIKVQLQAVTDVQTIASYNTAIASEQGKRTNNLAEQAKIGPVVTQLQAKLADKTIDDQTRSSISTMIDTLSAQSSQLLAAIKQSDLVISENQAKLSLGTKSANTYNSLIARLEAIAGNVGYKEISPRASLSAESKDFADAYASLVTKLSDQVAINTFAKLEELCSQDRLDFFLKTMTTQGDLDSVLIDGLCSKFNQTFGLTSSTPTNSLITSEKANAIALYNTVYNGQKTFESVEQDFIGLENSDSKKLVQIRGAKVASFWITFARAFIYGLKSLVDSPIGLDLENFLQQNDFFKNKTLNDAFSDVSSTASALDAAQLFLNTSKSTGEYAAPVVAGRQNFSAALGDMLNKPDLWSNPELWTPNFFKDFSVLPLDSVERVAFIKGALTSQLSANLQSMSSDQAFRDRLIAIAYLFVAYSQTLLSNSTDLTKSISSAFSTKLKTWKQKADQVTSVAPLSTTSSAASITQSLTKGSAEPLLETQAIVAAPPVIDQTAKASLENVKDVLYWLSKNIKCLMFYYKYCMEVGTKTSIQDFLVKEVAQLMIKNSQVASLISQSFDPFLISVFGINSQMLLEQSSAQRANYIKQMITSNAYVFAGIDKYSSMVSGAVDQAQTSALQSVATTLTESTFTSPLVKAEQISDLQKSLQDMIGSTTPTIQKMYTSFVTQTYNSASNGINIPTKGDIQVIGAAINTSAQNVATAMEKNLVTNINTNITNADQALASGISSAGTKISTTVLPYIAQTKDSSTNLQTSFDSANPVSEVIPY